MRPPKRILFVLHSSGLAGTERHVLWLATGMKRRGWDVSLAVSSAGRLLPRFRDAGISVHLVHRASGLSALYGLRLARLVWRLRPDVLHAHSGRLAGAVGRLLSVPVVIETRHGLGPGKEPPPRARLLWEALKSRLVHRTITVCQSDRARLVSGGLPEDRVFYVPNGIPEQPFQARPPLHDPIRLGFLGRLEPEKDPLFLVRLGPALERRMPGGWTLTVAGEGSLRLPLAVALEKAGLSARVSWLGETDGPDALLQRTDFLCVPSYREGQPLGVLEAMQAGVIPIARRLSSLEELLAGEPPAGLLLPPDPAAWAAEIGELARSPERMASLVREGRRRIEQNHRLDAMLTKIEKFYLDTFATAQSQLVRSRGSEAGTNPDLKVS